MCLLLDLIRHNQLLSLALRCVISSIIHNYTIAAMTPELAATNHRFRESASNNVNKYRYDKVFLWDML